MAATLLAASQPQAATAASKAPLGYQLLCLKSPGECQGGGAATVDGTERLLNLLRSVNASVNRAIVPRADGKADTWSASASAGDCEDYVLAKRRALLEQGLSAGALRIAHVRTRGGEDHAILVVKTTRGDFVLDNLDGKVRPLSQSGYRLVSMSGADPLDWN
jgi:predicted transglutaminase-like cysteine proteinase